MGQLGSTPTTTSIRHQSALVPSVADARTVAALLVVSKRIPVELAIEILHLADYTPTMSTESNRPIEVHSGWSGNKQSIAILQTRPIPAVPDVPLDSIERIRILTESHDQGFSSSLEYQGTREGSYSWFELALVRPTVPPPEPIPDPDHMPGSFASTESSPPAATVAPPPRPSRCLPQLETIARTRLYSNLHARREFLQHEVSFEKPRRDDGPSDSSTEPEPVDPERLTAGQDLVKLARPGDRFVLYAMAQYPAWSNYIRRCRIDVSIRAL